jgi:hypothetical protein
VAEFVAMPVELFALPDGGGKLQPPSISDICNEEPHRVAVARRQSDVPLHHGQAGDTVGCTRSPWRLPTSCN